MTNMWEQVGNIVTVPDVVGLPFGVGRDLAHDRGVTLANPDPDGPPVGALAWPGLFYITSQRPSAGTMVTRHASIAVEVTAHGSADQSAERPNPTRPPTDSAHAVAERACRVDLTGPHSS